jgi:penicillin-binding protein 1A
MSAKSFNITFNGAYGKRLKWVGLLLLLVIALSIAGYLVIDHQLPPILKVTDYRPPLATQVFSDDLELIGEYATQYRLLTPIDDIPPLVRKAFIAAEDNRFFEHSGIDYLGILRAMLKNIQAGGVKQGGSTITQQVAKSLLLSPERTLLRKVKEALLAFRIEKHLNKDEILYLYLNQIYLGHGSYGVAAAARAYFNKHLNQLDLAETATLAGLPTAPSRDNPFMNPERAKSRRSYVLKMMEELHFISSEEHKQADAEPLVLNGSSKDLNVNTAPYFAEHVRRYLADKYTDEQLYGGGMKVYTTLSLSMQYSAQEAVKWNLHELDRRVGYRGPLKHLNDTEIAGYIKEWEKKSAAANHQALIKPNTDIGDDAYRATKLNALVVEIDDAKSMVKVLTEDDQGWIPLALMDWARKVDPEITYEEARLSKPSQALKRGDMVLVRAADISELSTNKKDKDKLKPFQGLKLFALTQEPEVQGALLAVNPENGFVYSMVGGYDYKKSEFNRAIQAKRQPGSAFKPLIYAAALDKGYTPAKVLLDAPIVFDDPVNDKVWRPKNFSGTFLGEMLFRTALIDSRNVVTVKILQDIGIDYAIDYSKKLGIETELVRDNTLALGSSVVTPFELTNPYMVFANSGVLKPKVFIKKILDRDGNVLERHTNDEPSVDLTVQIQDAKAELLATKMEMIEVAPKDGTDNPENSSEKKLRILRPGQVISEQTAYITTHLLNEVVNFGTGYRARALNRPAAGKTGTTNEHIDAWFVGYTPDLLATTWVGFDEKRSLGKLETGAKAASPMWLKFMSEALEDRPKKDFHVPGGISFVRIDSETGKLATDKTAKPVVEAFLSGTEPTETSDKAGTAKDFFLEE